MKQIKIKAWLAYWKGNPERIAFKRSEATYMERLGYKVFPIFIILLPQRSKSKKKK